MPELYVISDPAWVSLDTMPKVFEKLQYACEHAVSPYEAGSLKVLQYRNKLTDDFLQKKQEALALKTICDQLGILFLINDDIHLAKHVKADGVHLGQKDGNVQQARELLGGDAVVGRTCHGDLKLIEQAAKDGADYVGVGAVFASSTKSVAPVLGPEKAIVLCQQSPLPVVLIGGINQTNQSQLASAQCDALAMVSGFWSE